MSKPLLKSEWEVMQEQFKSEKAVLKALEEHYKEALNALNDRIAAMMGRGDANLPHVIRRIEYQKMVRAQVQAALDTLHGKEYETVSAYLQDTYTDAFVGTMYTLYHQDVPVIVPIDQNAVIKAVTIDSKVKDGVYTALGVDMTHLKKTIANEITRGIASGLLYDDITRNISNAAMIPMRRARTITRTEAGRVQEQASFDAAEKAKEAGADVVKQWSAVRDGKTRDTHRALDGQVRELNEPFSIGTHKAMHPHGFGLAEEDINCRCTMLTRARAALDEDELNVMQKRAEFFGVDKTDSFAEFKEKYLKAAQTVENTGKSGIINYGEMTSEEIAARYMKPDGTNLLSKEFSAMPVEIQREAVRGYDKAISMYGSISPQRIKTERMKNNVYALYSPLYKTITLNSSIPDALEEAYATVIHEMTHHAEYSGLFDSKKVLNRAFKKLGINGTSKKADTMRMMTTGIKGPWKESKEVVAHAIERQVTGRGNPLTEAIYSVMKEEGIIK